MFLNKPKLIIKNITYWDIKYLNDTLYKLVSKLFLPNIERLQKRYKKNLFVGLGTIATGILGDEPILKPKKLQKDLIDMKKVFDNETNPKIFYPFEQC